MAAPPLTTSTPSSLAAPSPTCNTVGVYVHVPFCARLCPYCDFDTQDRELHLIAPFATALLREIALAPRLAVHSIFLGGGTPSVLRPEQLRAILDACRARFSLQPSCEITVECNPNNVREGRIAAYRAAGVNRLSLGVQVMDDALLHLLGRQHSADRVRSAVGAARAAGIENLSLDLMYGLPGQSLADWANTLDAALALAPEHLSAYLLTLQDWTPMGQQVARGELHLPDDDTIAEQYALARARLTGAGLAQYEISNWAIPGRESRHNLGYWRSEPYLGLGPGAVSWLDGVRRKQTPVVADYLAALAEDRQVFVDEEPLDPPIQRWEALMLGLRLRNGIEPNAFRRRFAVDLVDACGPGLAELLAAGCLEWEDGRLRIADGALLVSNEVLLRLED